LSLNQDEFQTRAFLEMLHYASSKLRSRKDPAVAAANDNEINQHKNEFCHVFLTNGMEITTFTDIPKDCKTLICGLTNNFKGVFDSDKLVTYHGSRHVKNQNIKNCLFNKTYQWARDKMIGWNEGNGKIEGQNKILDLTNHIEGVVKT
jgi:hypothetical protein